MAYLFFLSLLYFMSRQNKTTKLKWREYNFFKSYLSQNFALGHNFFELPLVMRNRVTSQRTLKFCYSEITTKSKKSKCLNLENEIPAFQQVSQLQGEGLRILEAVFRKSVYQQKEQTRYIYKNRFSEHHLEDFNCLEFAWSTFAIVCTIENQTRWCLFLSTIIFTFVLLVSLNVEKELT